MTADSEGVCLFVIVSGNGLLVLRKAGTGLKATWAYSNPLMATQGDAKHPNPLYDPEYARSPTYPFFYIRYISALLTSPIMVHYICQVVGVPRSTTWSLLFTSVLAQLTCPLSLIAAPAFWSDTVWPDYHDRRSALMRAQEPTRMLLQRHLQEPLLKNRCVCFYAGVDGSLFFCGGSYYGRVALDLLGHGHLLLPRSGRCDGP